MKRFGYEKWIFAGMAGSYYLIFTGKDSFAIQGMLFVIAILLLGILNVLMDGR